MKKNIKIILAISMSLILLVGGGMYYYLSHPMPKLNVKEGEGTLVLHYPEPGGSNTVLNPVSAVTEMGDAGIMNFSVYKMGYMTFESTNNTEIFIQFMVMGEIGDRYRVDSLRVQSENIAYENGTVMAINFLGSYLGGSGVKPYPLNEVNAGAWSGGIAFVKFQVEKNNFTATGAISIDIPSNSYNHTFLVEFKAILYVDNVAVPATIYIHLVGNVKE